MANIQQETKEEQFPVVDPEGTVIGKASRSQCHNGSKMLHPVVHLHIFNSKGELFLQKRSLAKDVQPGKWDTSSAGHIDYGETAGMAVIREASEELGIIVSNPVFIEKYVIETDLERELSYCYRIVYDGEIHIDNEEVADGRFWTFEEIRQQLHSGIFTQNFASDFVRFLDMRP
jgi:isopentenyldiphosphate isomerase